MSSKNDLINYKKLYDAVDNIKINTFDNDTYNLNIMVSLPNDIDIHGACLFKDVVEGFIDKNHSLFNTMFREYIKVKYDEKSKIYIDWLNNELKEIKECVN